ncbi:hypothetical protein [Streptomyces asoensis]|uniref:Regulatory protein n=1 Tax=Streptomyces asoensis TaxID=249586 RepID=A0ABQ3S5P2_9ACTN|nr:hypothetical protein [Streptomyces asoensis]GGQ99000.1 hypothetical protein GCM10010496_75070 [Streptomyces asoensis]GHI63448.1 hypothetical protein Saso_50980 [Streptomyces asoensis]
MSENASATELASHYTAQVTSDLDRNTKEQERIGAEIASLEEQLTALRHDHSVLVSIREAIAAAPAPAGADRPSAAAPVPSPRRKAAASGSGKRAQPKKSASRVTRKAEKPAAPKRAAAAGPAADSASSAQPTLVDLVRRHLTEQKEPRSAAEITTALGQAHPERSVKATVVRTTLEGLVAKAQAHRSKQGTSVFYTVADAPQAAGGAKAAGKEKAATA